MASWKQLLVSGSAAALSSLTLDNPLTVANGGTGRSSVTANNFLIGNGTGTLNLVGSNGSGNVVRTTGASGVSMSGSFSGSFHGDGSNLTNINVSNISAPGSNTQVIFNSGGSFATDSDFTFSSNTLTVNGSTLGAALNVSSTATIGNLTGGSNSNNVIIDGGSGILRSRAIDSRVWGSTLVDSANGVNNRLATFTDSNSLNGEANLTFDGTTLGITGNITTTGNATLGNAASDSLTINAGTITSPNMPTGSGTEVARIVMNETVGGELITWDIDDLIASSSGITGTGANNQVAIFNGTDTLDSSGNFTFNGTTVTANAMAVTTNLTVNGNTTLGNASGDSVTINAATIDIGNVAAGTDNTVLIRTAGGDIAHDEIDSRVWGSTLVDGSGASTRVAFWSDANTLSSDADYTYNNSTNVLTIGNSTFGEDVEIAGNLTILGDTITANVSSLLIEDRFILLNSGSATGDGGIIVQTEAGFSGVALGWDDSAGRFGTQLTSALAQNATAISPDAYVALAVSGSGADTEHQKLGNIRTDGGEIYIWA